MSLSLHRRHQHPPGHRLVTEAGPVDTGHRLVRQGRREVLIGNGDRAVLPEVANPPHRRRDHSLVEARNSHTRTQGPPGHASGALRIGNRNRILVGTGKATSGLVRLTPGRPLGALR